MFNQSMMKKFFSLGALMLLCSFALQADADTAKGKILMTVEWNTSSSNTSDHKSATFDLDMLDALPQESFQTTTIWTEGEITFSGPPLLALLDSLGLTAESITAQALNDYNVELLPDTLDAQYPIIATRMNGETFSIRDGGPLWLVFPYDKDEKYRQEDIFAQSIWQLTKLKAD